MSLNQKYTWHDFLKGNPEHKEKGTKRTSSEGKKAFESAYKKHMKEYLAQRLEKFNRDIERATKKRDEVRLKVKELKKGSNTKRINVAQKKLGVADAAIARLQKQQTRNKAVQKSFK